MSTTLDERMLAVEKQVAEHGVHLEHIAEAIMEVKASQEHFVDEMRRTAKEIQLAITGCKTTNCDILAREVEILEKEVSINKQQMGDRVLQKDFNERFDALEKKLRVMIYLSEHPRAVIGVLFLLWISTFDAVHARLEAIIGKLLTIFLGA